MADDELDDKSLAALVPPEVRPSPPFRLTVEPVLFLMLVSEGLSGAVLTNLYVGRTCRVTLGLNVTTCDILQHNRSSPESRQIEEMVQPHVLMLEMVQSILNSTLPAILCVFLGPWSDANGRRPLILVPLIGYVFHSLLCAGLSLVPGLDPRYLLFGVIPIATTGGLVSVITACFSYITDITEAEQRGFRMGVVEASIFLGALVGTATSSYLFMGTGSYGYVAVFSTSAILYFIAFLYSLLCLTESVHHVEDCRNEAPKGLFNWQHVRSMVDTCCQQREPGGRAVIFLIITVLASFILTMEGEGAVTFLFTREKFGWNIRQYTIYTSAAMVMIIVGMLVGGSVLSSWLKVPDTYLLLVVFVLQIARALVQTFSPEDWFMYLGCAVGILGGLAGPLSRSILSKIVPNSDIGKVFCLTASVEALTPLAAAPLYTLLYRNMLHSFPGAVFALTASIFSVDFVLMSIVCIIQWRYSLQTYCEN